MNTTYTVYNLQQSSLTTHFSVSSVGSVQLDPSSGNCLTYLSLDLMPIPHEAVHGDQLIHSDIIHVDASREQNGHMLMRYCMTQIFPKSILWDLVMSEWIHLTKITFLIKKNFWSKDLCLNDWNSFCWLSKLCLCKIIKYMNVLS